MPRQSAFKPRRHYFYDPRDGDHIMEDGDFMHVPIYLQDADQRAVTQHFARDAFVRDQLAAQRACAGHRPGPVIATLCASPTANMTDASNDLLERRGATVPATFADRERALDEVERRQQWRTVLDARVKVEPPDDDDEDDGDESDGRELAGSAEYPGGDYAGNDDDDDNDELHGSEEYPHNGGRYPDGSVLTEAERAYQERTQRGDQLWRTGSAVSRADANQRQLERWRGK